MSTNIIVWKMLSRLAYIEENSAKEKDKLMMLIQNIEVRNG